MTITDAHFARRTFPVDQNGRCYSSRVIGLRDAWKKVGWRYIEAGLSGILEQSSLMPRWHKPASASACALIGPTINARNADLTKVADGLGAAALFNDRLGWILHCSGNLRFSHHRVKRFAKFDIGHLRFLRQAHAHETRHR